jgi:uncharacterized protein with GYD domain
MRVPSEENHMGTYISLVSFTQDGVQNVKDSPKRYEAFRAMAKKLGVTVKSVYWTVGSYDIVVTCEGPDDAVTAALLKTGSLGNVRTQTMRAYAEDEMEKILAKVP